MNIRPLPAFLILVISVASCVTAKPRANDIEALRRLIGTSAVACPDRSDCLCVDYQNNREELFYLRFSRAQYCPTAIRNRFVMTTWDQQNRLVDEGYYVNGEMDGNWTSWHPNGRKAGEGSWMHGKQQGQQLAWHENGTKAEETYFETGLQEGRFVRWYDNGNIQIRGQYLHGKPDGVWTFYEEDGRIRSRKTTVRGKFVETDAGSERSPGKRSAPGIRFH